MSGTLMACGDVTHATDASGAPVCIVHAGLSLDVEAHTIAPEPDLTGRKSKCGSCRTIQHSDGTTLEGVRLWKGSLPFLRVRPDYDETADPPRLDSHYCGCRGWS